MGELDVNHVSVFGNAELAAHVSEACDLREKEKVLAVNGALSLLKSETGLAVRIPLQSDLILELRSGISVYEILDENEFRKSQISVTFPVISVTSEKRLKKVLSDSSLMQSFG